MLMHVRRECSIISRVVNDVKMYCVYMFDLLPFAQIDATVCNSLAAFVQKVKPISCKYTSIIHFSTIRVILNNINEINNFILNQFMNKFIREIFLVSRTFR